MISFKEYLTEQANKAGTYAGVRPSEKDADQLSNMLGKFKVPNPEPKDKLHVTLLYSRKHLPNYVPNPNLSYKAEIKNLEIWPTKSGKNCLVMTMVSPALSSRHNALMKEHDATFDYPEFKVHLSLSYDVGDFDHAELSKHLPKSITLSKEYWEELNTVGK